MLKPDRAKGRPGIYAGFSSAGDPILVKVWPRTSGQKDQDLEEIWRHELRQLHRLAGYPGAADCIAHLYDAGYDAQGFYLILTTGQRRPLQTLIDHASPGHWVKQPRHSGNRARIWKNLVLLARGLETLHSQGLLHRNIDHWAVLAAGGEDPDFQLTGFEWSMRVVGAESKLQTGRRRAAYVHDSFLRDWQMYGILAADLLGVKLDRLMSLAIAPHEVAEHLSADEVLLLRNLTQVQPSISLSGEIVVARIEQITRTLAAELKNHSPKLHVALRLGSGTPLGDHIRTASDKEVESDDAEAQLDYVISDLNDAPMLMAVKPVDGGEGIRLILRGKNLFYRLQEFRLPRSQDMTWDFAYCDGAEKKAPAPVNVIGQRVLEPASVELMSVPSANDLLPRLRGKLRSWNEWRREFLAEAAPPTSQQITHRALSLIQFLESLYAVAGVFPVEVISRSNEDSTVGSDECSVCLRARPDPERENLARALKLKPPALRLRLALVGEGVKPDGWMLSDSKSLGEKSSADTEWRFQTAEPAADGPDIYTFRGAKPAPLLREGFLLPEGLAGQDVQFRRRLKALKALSEHDELLRMISDPRQRVIESHEVLTEDEAFDHLDQPKQIALRELTSTLPLYLIQGPPGVGKTRLVRDLVRRRFEDEPTSRLLLTAQSNAAVDHLMDELGAILDTDATDGPLVVRCSAKDQFDSPSRFDIRLQSRVLITKLADSVLAKKLPAKLRRRLSTLAKWVSTQEDSNGPGESTTSAVLGRPPAHVLRAFEGAVARAANIVFATTNSGELERLIDERGQCDWAIVEEAGKATGSELVSPMLLSHRRLMIGDHKQLPPFGSDQMIELLKNPHTVKEVLLIGEEFVGRSLRDATTEEILDEVEEEGEIHDDAIPSLCAEALRVLMFFENTIESEFARQKRHPSARPIAKKLTQQHRMRPEIANLVSRCFYSDLTSHPECVARYQTQQPPFLSLDPSRLPNSPIVIIDMPYVQSAIDSQVGDRFPRWNNPAEVGAVLNILDLVGANPNAAAKPTLAILSPYSQQVSRLAEAVRDVPSLTQFMPPTHNGVWCHTVDSFQGGEADLVVISLVRNNGHSNVQSAFGFLSDIRRMNVLLSRARWQLILVASLDFIREVLVAVRGTDGALQVKFMEEMLKVIEDGKQHGSVSTVPFDRLCARTQ